MLEGADVGRDPYGVAQGARLLLAADASDAFAFEQYVKALQVLKLSNAAARLTGAPISPGGGAFS